MQPTIHSLHIYPVKSCQGIDCNSVELTGTGFKYDRHWMLVDKQGRFLSQRQLPAMARIETALTPTSLIVSVNSDAQLEIPLNNPHQERVKVNIWNDQCSAALVATQASRWFSDFLNFDCDLVTLPDSEKRLVSAEYAQAGQTVGFADGFPLLILSKASADLLSSKLGEPVDINRFRANIIIGNCPAHAEDSWNNITVNDMRIDLVKPCSRCVIPSIDQQTSKKHASLLKVLASYRRNEGKVYVGQNGLHRSTGIISTGQTVTTDTD